MSTTADAQPVDGPGTDQSWSLTAGLAGPACSCRLAAPVTSSVRDTRLWHPFADMAAVRGAEVVIERGEGIWVFDTEGRRYLDGTAALWYSNVGHGRKEIAEAVAAQLSRLEAYSIFGDLANPPALELADRLAGLAPMPEPRVFLDRKRVVEGK